MVPQVRIGLTTPSLPRMCATTTLLRHPIGSFGGDKGIRTPDLRIANASLYQLSYIPKRTPRIIAFLLGGVKIYLILSLSGSTRYFLRWYKGVWRLFKWLSCYSLFNSVP